MRIAPQGPLFDSAKIITKIFHERMPWPSCECHTITCHDRFCSRHLMKCFRMLESIYQPLLNALFKEDFLRVVLNWARSFTTLCKKQIHGFPSCWQLLFQDAFNIAMYVWQAYLRCLQRIVNFRTRAGLLEITMNEGEQLLNHCHRPSVTLLCSVLGPT